MLHNFQAQESLASCKATNSPFHAPVHVILLQRTHHEALRASRAGLCGDSFCIANARCHDTRPRTRRPVQECKFVFFTPVPASFGSFTCSLLYLVQVRLCTVEKFLDGHMRKDCPKISIRIGRCTQFQAPLYRNGLVIFEERRADYEKHFKHMDCVIHSYDCGAKCDPGMSGDRCELRPLTWRHDLKQHISGWENKASSFTCKEFQEPENPPSP